MFAKFASLQEKLLKALLFQALLWAVFLRRLQTITSVKQPLGAFMSKIYNSKELHELVLPMMANHHGTLFAGFGLQLMCKAAFLVSREFAQCEIVMAGVNTINFICPVPIGSSLLLRAEVKRVGSSSMTTHVTGFIQPLKEKNEQVLNGSFEMVAVDAQGRPCVIQTAVQRQAIHSTRISV